MALPLSVPTFYRMPDALPAGSLISDLLDAIWTSAKSTTDYRGTALPSTHLWTVIRRQPVVVTEAVTATPPAGTPMTFAPALIWAGRIANAGTMASPDASAASVLQCGLVKTPGAYSDWSSATPFTTGSFSGYWRAALVAANTAATIVRVFVSQESIFVQIITTALVQSWNYLGAIVEPQSADTALAGESDNRLYGMVTSGGTSTVSATWLSTAATVFGHSTTANQHHAMVFTPGAGTLIPGGRRTIYATPPTALGLQDPAGAYGGDLMEFGVSTASNTNAGNRRGTFRGIYCAGQVQSGRRLRNGSSEDQYHYISMDTSAAGDGFALRAAA